MENINNYIVASEAAKILGLKSAGYINKFYKDGLVKGVKMHGCLILYDKQSVIEYANTLNKKKSVYQYTVDGKFVKRHNNVRSAAIATGIKPNFIYACLSGTLLKTHGNRWFKEFKGENIPKIRQSIAQIDPLTKNVITVYDSITELRNELGLTKCRSIYRCLAGTLKTAYGSKWIYKEQ